MGVHARPRHPGYRARHAAPPAPGACTVMSGTVRKAPPALALAGLALTVPQLTAHAATLPVKQGDTLTAIAARVYGHADDWGWLWQANKATVSNPDLIYPGQQLTLPAAPPPPSWVPKVPLPRLPAHISAAATAAAGVKESTDTAAAAVVQNAPASGIYGCAGLEGLWDTAGGSPASARIAASVAMAESGGNPAAVSPTGDFGLWQVNGSHGQLATLNPAGNARAAVEISGDGSNWGAWTTYTSGAYAGRC
jgi:hypothetical protein